MSLVRPTTVALSSAAFVATLLTGAQAHAAERPAATQLASQAAAAADTSQRIASGSTTPGAGWQQYLCCGLYIDVDTSAANFSGQPTYTISVGGAGDQWALTGTSSIYSPTATGFRVYIRFSNGTSMTPADATANLWYVNWIGVDNP